MHVRHINYNDFLPLMPERDLNYRYSLRVCGEDGREKSEKKREKKGERERGGENGQQRGPTGPSAVITGCARTFQESDSRQNSRVMGQSCPPPSSSFRSFMSLDSSFAPHVHTYTPTHIVINIFR